MIGAINSYIKLINSTANDESEERISKEWRFHLENSEKKFVATIKVYGFEERLCFEQYEWKSIDHDILKNEKLRNLLNRFV
jgi:hypothetical protein